ncbi:CinA family protein [Microlunatus elymi]|uniref:CinA family protein n=1 Tax=Microlunatus elymi TaxID=2596828 RepID=A0A516Q1A6_9ACTN|nr:CinA family protein [Microlunatus elymi]QDP97207.1 CinA family protein [Microlunatus elymi]
MTAPESLGELATELIELLIGRDETVATAESLTGGLIGATLTGVPGSSEAYRGGVVSYATDLKASLAGVRQSTLAEHGAVSQLTAVEMALGVASRCDTTWGIAVTGVAGPDPQEGHPPGTVFVAVGHQPGEAGWDDPAGDSVVCVRELALTGSRAVIREQTVAAALRQALRVVGPPTE